MTNGHPCPRQSLDSVDVIAIVVGLVIGAGIFKAPAVVAANAGSEVILMSAWMLGGLVSLMGALCYAELAAAYPHAGGEYHFLTSAYGARFGFLFAWSRLVVLQTGSIALLAFVFGDYVADLLPLYGEAGPSLFAATAVLALTLLNILGLDLTRRAQNLLTLLTLAGLALVIGAGLLAETPAPAQSAQASDEKMFGLAMVFVLLTYGGWNEVAYVSAELKDVQRKMPIALVAGIGLVILIYLLMNLSYLKVMGLQGMSSSDVVTADLIRIVLGEEAARWLSALIAIAVGASINVTILTGARTNYAFARNFPLFRFLGRWHPRLNAPVNALIVQGAIALLMVFAASFGRSGFEAMVQYVSPVFWLFFLFTAIAVFVLRRRDPRPRPFRVPGYPIVPLVFATSCAYMLYSSLAYTGTGALLGALLLGAGIPVLLLDEHRRFRRHPSER